FPGGKGAKKGKEEESNRGQDAGERVTLSRRPEKAVMRGGCSPGRRPLVSFPGTAARAGSHRRGKERAQPPQRNGGVRARRVHSAEGSAVGGRPAGDRKSTRLNSSHVKISYAVFCLKKKTKTPHPFLANSPP